MEVCNVAGITLQRELEAMDEYGHLTSMDYCHDVWGYCQSSPDLGNFSQELTAQHAFSLTAN